LYTRGALAGAVALLSVALSACSGGSGSPASPASTGSSAGADPSSETAGVAWTPCDGLTAARVGRLLGEPVREQDGTAGQPRCAFVPRTRGGAAYQVSYLWFDGGLDAALRSTGRLGSQLRPVRVPGADAARLAVARRASGVLTTGFVQTDGLVQSVNAVQVRPYDERAVVAGTRALLGELARQAPSPTASSPGSP
jgi:hypothetical protein